MPISDEIAEQIWKYVIYNPQPFPWYVKRDSVAAKKLETITNPPTLIFQRKKGETISAEDKVAQNIQLRKFLASYLKKGNAQQEAKWIIKSWGGIKSLSDEKLSNFVNELGNFTKNEIAAFIAKNGQKNISSWSKLVAFSDHQDHAIYDARTAIILNCALYHNKSNFYFYMPLSQNNKIKAAYTKLMISYRDRGEPKGYIEYINLLKKLVELKFKTPIYDEDRELTSILEAEMTLFANAPAVAKRFLNFE